jgi:acyl-CoA thioesterase-1
VLPLRIRCCALLAAALAVAGCHRARSAPEGGNAAVEETPAAANRTQTPAHDSRPVIVAFGDSLTAGFGTDSGESYPDYLQRDLDRAGYPYRVVNEGVSGNTTKDGVERLPEVLALHPEVVIVAFGGNDGLRGLPIAATRENLQTIVSTLRKAGAKVVLGGITLPPNYGADYIRQFNQTYALLSKQFHVPLLPFLLIHVYGTPGSMQPDGIHATAQGNAQVARNLLPLIEPLLRKEKAAQPRITSG